MSNQYFENNENLKSDIFEINYYFKNHIIKFISDAGVFSRKGIDFGSSLLLKTICIKENTKTILDVGCGYGTLGITLGLTNPNTTIDMVDVNLRALDLTRKNALANSVNNVNIYESNMYENVNKNFDMIVTNPPIRAGKKIVHGIILGAYDHLNDGGSMWCVIQKKQGAESALRALKEKYKDVKVVCKDKLYYIIEAIR